VPSASRPRSSIFAPLTSFASRSQHAGMVLEKSPPAPLNDMLLGLDGQALSCEELTAILRKAGDITEDQAVATVEVVPGSERRWPQSHSAKLRLSLLPSSGEVEAKGEERLIFLKKVLTREAASDSLEALCRDLASNANEAHFYNEFQDLLVKRGLPLLKAYHVDLRLPWMEQNVDITAADEASLRKGGMLCLLESAEGYFQTSPLSVEQAKTSLNLLAKMHGAAWQDEKLLARAAHRLQPVAGYWTLEKRGQEEMQRMAENWKGYVAAFADARPELFARPGIAELAQRIQSLAPRIAKEMAASPSDPFATLVHGDYKAMNIFLKETLMEGESAKRRRLSVDSETDALPIDFQWTGVGFGMSDVAMHLSHSVALDAMRDGGERSLVLGYHEALVSSVGSSQAASYTAEVAWRHYCLGVIDYARMVIGCFFKNATPETFAARADKENVGLCYRNVEASLEFVERVDGCLRVIEAEAPPS